MSPYVELMKKAVAHARESGARVPVLSPWDETVLEGAVPVRDLQAMGVRVVPWTTNEPETMRKLIRMGVDGLVSDRPDLLRRVVIEEGRAGFEVVGHRGARGLRPENTLPAFEAGLDCGVDAIETDVGVTRDGFPLIWHEQFIEPKSCRRSDGREYGAAERVYVRDVSMAKAQGEFICDKLRRAEQRNELELSPVSLAFSAREGMEVYAPMSVEQLFRFVRFYGECRPERADYASAVRFNLEAKIFPEGILVEGERNRTVGLEEFVETLCEEVVRAGKVERTNILSFDFRVLMRVAEQYPGLGVYYLTEELRG